jgi:hypothetical protein
MAETDEEQPIPVPFPILHTGAQLSNYELFALSAVAPAIAVVFTNPFDTAKVILRLPSHSNLLHCSILALGALAAPRGDTVQQSKQVASQQGMKSW